MTGPAAIPPSEPPRRRGRPPRAPQDSASRAALIRAGLEHLTERGYAAAALDAILAQAGASKSVFYHHFASKEVFGLALVDEYGAFFARFLDAALRDPAQPSALLRLWSFARSAEAGMARHGFRRGCLIGNLGQEMNALPEPFRARLIATLRDWEARTAACLQDARMAGEIGPHHDPAALAARFWIGWEGAVLRAKLERRAAPLRIFTDGFIDGIAVPGHPLAAMR